MQLNTTRLELRPPEPGDFAEFLRLRTDAGVRRYLGGPMSESAAWKQFGLARTSWLLGRPSLFMIREKVSGAYLGLVGPWSLFGSQDEEVIWELHAAHQGKGLAFEAGTAVLSWLFADSERDRVRFYIHPHNAPSLALAARLGGAPDDRPRPPNLMHRKCDLAFICRREDWLARAHGALGPAAPSAELVAVEEGRSAGRRAHAH